MRSDNPTGGTAFAAFEVFCVPGLLEANPLLVISMGDRVVPPAVFHRMLRRHCAGEREADMTFLTAEYEPPKNRGKGRVVRDEQRRVHRIVEERDIVASDNDLLMELTEGNCPLYLIRAVALHEHLKDLTNDNAQSQYYITDIIESIVRDGGIIRTVTTTADEPEYDLLCSDVTRPMDLAFLEGHLSSSRGLLSDDELDVEQAAIAICENRPPGQIAAIARQLEELVAGVGDERLDFAPDQPVAIGISGGRLRIAFMHPDMGRFFGPAWQMPIGAADENGDEQIVILAQTTADKHIHLYPMNPEYCEATNSLPADNDVMYPGEEIADLYAYEQFGTRMSESLLQSLGYFSDEELALRRRNGDPLPPASAWAASNMRRPFALVGNAIASMRTLRSGNLGAKVQQNLGREHFRGLRIVSTGNIPQGGFSSSSAVTVAAKNAINALYQFGIPADLLVHLACPAEYGTGVRAGSLDQATEQKGRASVGTLISSNPKDNYRILGTYPVPGERFRIIFPYSVERDVATPAWSWGMYGEDPEAEALTAGEMRKMTGKAAELAAILTRLPLDTDFFRPIEDDLIADGALDHESRAWICSVLKQIPLRAGVDELQKRVESNRSWYVDQLQSTERLDPDAANEKADAIFASLFSGWREPRDGVPLRAMVAYLFAEVVRNFHLIHHPESWIESVTLSQRGDRCAVPAPARRDAARPGLGARHCQARTVERVARTLRRPAVRLRCPPRRRIAG